MVKKIINLISIVILYGSTLQTGFAGENATAPPLYVNIGSETKLITFNPDKTAKVDIQPDHTHNSVQVSLPPGSTGEIMLTSCNNQQVTANQSANCPVSPSLPTTLTLVDVNHWPSASKGALIGGITAAIIMEAAICTGRLFIISVLVPGLVGAAIGAAIGAAAEV